MSPAPLQVPASAPATAVGEHGLRRSLSSAQLSMIAIGGAVGTGLFLGSAFAISLAGPAVLLSYLVGALITLLLMGCLAEMTVVHPTAGSFGDWAELYLSPLAGFLVRYSYWAGVVFALGTEISAIAIYMRFWFPAVPGVWWISLFSAALIGVNTFSVNVFGSVEYVFSAVKVFAILAFLILGVWFLIRSHEPTFGFGNYTAGAGFFPHGLWGMWVAVLVALFSFFSIEMIAVAAGEAREPQRAIVGAFRATMFRLAFFYLFTLALVLAIAPHADAGPLASPFVRVMQATGLPYAATAFNGTVLVAALSAMNSQIYTTARMLFALARAKQAPAIFGRLSIRGVPVSALLASTVGIAVAAALNALYPERAFLLLFAISCFGPMFTWLMIFLTHLAFRAHHQGGAAAFRMWGFPWLTLGGAALMFSALVTTLFLPAFRPTLLCGLPFLILLTAVFYLRRSRSDEANHFPD